MSGVYTVIYYSCHDDYQFRDYVCIHSTVLSNIQGYWNADEGSLALSLTEVINFASNPCAAADVVHQLVASSSILAVSKGRHVQLINCHELIMTNDGIDKLLLFDKPTPTHTRKVKTIPLPNRK